MANVSAAPVDIDAQIQNAMMLRHTHRALAAVLTNKFHLLDPEIGDERGFMLAPIISWVRRTMNDPIIIGSYPFLAPDRREKIIADWKAAHADDKPDDEVRTVQDALGGSHSVEFGLLVDKISTILGPDLMNILALALRFTIKKSVAVTEFGIVFSSKPQFLSEKDDASEHVHRAKFMNSCYKVLITILKASYSMRATDSETPNGLSCVAWQLLDVLYRMNSSINGYGEQKDVIPVIPLYHMMRVSSYADFYLKNIILFRVKREEIIFSNEATRFVPAGTVMVIFEFLPDHIYHHDDRIDPRIGTWRGQIRQITEEAPSAYLGTVVTVHDCYSSYIPKSGGEGFASDDDWVFATTLQSSQPHWLLLKQAAGWPPYPAAAQNEVDNHETIYANVYPEQERQEFYFDEQTCGGLSTDPFDPVIAPALPQEREMAARQAKASGLCGRQGYCYSPDSDGVWKRRTPVPLQINNTYVATIGHVVEDSRKWMERHAKEGEHEPIIGGYAIPVGDTCYSFEHHEDAVRVNKMATTEEKTAEYLRLYPGNARFIE